MQVALPTGPELQAIKNLKRMAREEYIVPGTPVCGGCGGLEALRLAAKVLGPKTVFVNAAGCFTLLAVFPYTPFKGSWLYTTMASAAAGAQGVRDALDVLMARGKMSAEDDVEVVVKKDLFAIWLAHRPAYLVTVSPRYPVDLTNKFLKAKTRRGPKLFIAQAPC